MADVTARFGITEPAAARTDAADVPLYIRNIAQALEAQGTMFAQGTAASRPAFGKQGRIYFATDTGILSYDNGSSWTDIGPVGTGIADNAITLAKMADNSVGSAEIIDGSVGAAEIADGTVGSAEIASALKPSAGAGAGTEALRAIGAGAGLVAAGTHAAQHASGGADPVTNIQMSQLAAAVQAAMYSVGDVKMVGYDVVAGVNEPAGWLLMDGRGVSTTTYAALFALLQYAHGGSGATFNLPDSRGRKPTGKGTGSGLTLRNVGQLFGTETHPLVIGEIPSHSHGGGTGGNSVDHTHGMNHDHAIQVQAGSAGASGVFGAGSGSISDVGGGGAGGPVKFFFGNTAGQSVGHTHAISAEGGGASHNNMSPSFVLSFLIKT
jgi:microcystin-dependent protein